MTNAAQTPQTDEEYAIHALTIHGVFFERKCQEIVQQAQGWSVRDTNYPVEHKGKASNLDIWAEKQYSSGSHLLLPIECKKNNREFVDWIFFTREKEATPNLHIQNIRVDMRPADQPGWIIQRRELPTLYDVAFADEARETKGNYLQIKDQKDRTKTSNAAITEAATQIAIATQSLIQQEIQIMGRVSDHNVQEHARKLPPYFSFLCFPTIVTTANLYTCTFREADIDLTIGEIPFDKANLIPCPYLLYNYPLPVSLQSPPSYEGVDYQRYWNAVKRVARMPIFIVQSTSFPTFLERLQMPRKLERFGNEELFSMELQPNNP